MWNIQRLLTKARILRVNMTLAKNFIAVPLPACSLQLNLQRKTINWVQQEKAKKTIVIALFKGAFPLRCRTLILEFHVMFRIQSSPVHALHMCTFICLLVAQLNYLILLPMQIQSSKGIIRLRASVIILRWVILRIIPLPAHKEKIVMSNSSQWCKGFWTVSDHKLPCKASLCSYLCCLTGSSGFHSALLRQLKWHHLDFWFCMDRIKYLV